MKELSISGKASSKHRPNLSPKSIESLTLININHPLIESYKSKKQFTRQKMPRNVDMEVVIRDLLPDLELEEEESDYYDDDWEGSDEEVYKNYDSSSDSEWNVNVLLSGKKYYTP